MNKEERQQFKLICKKLDHKRHKDRITYHKIEGECGYKTFVIFDGTEVSEGGWLIGRKWMTAKYMNKLVSKWVNQSFETRVDKLYKNNKLPEEYLKICKDRGMLEYTGGDGQCGGCRWFAAFDADYGLCFCEGSPNEGKITFEHAGCIYHSFIQELLSKDKENK